MTLFNFDKKPKDPTLPDVINFYGYTYPNTDTLQEFLDILDEYGIHLTTDDVNDNTNSYEIPFTTTPQIYNQIAARIGSKQGMLIETKRDPYIVFPQTQTVSYPTYGFTSTADLENWLNSNLDTYWRYGYDIKYLIIRQITTGANNYIINSSNDFINQLNSNYLTHTYIANSQITSLKNVNVFCNRTYSTTNDFTDIYVNFIDRGNNFGTNSNYISMNHPETVSITGDTSYFSGTTNIIDENLNTYSQMYKDGDNTSTTKTVTQKIDQKFYKNNSLEFKYYFALDESGSDTNGSVSITIKGDDGTTLFTDSQSCGGNYCSRGPLTKCILLTNDYNYITITYTVWQDDDSGPGYYVLVRVYEIIQNTPLTTSQVSSIEADLDDILKTLG